MRPAAFVSLVLAGALSLALFSLKYQVQDLEDELVDLNRTILADQEAIHVLKAEWSHLNDPRRLRSLARRHLGMRPVMPAQLATIADLPPRPADTEEMDAARPEEGRAWSLSGDAVTANPGRRRQ
jgi:cell division protein FtsL